MRHEDVTIKHYLDDQGEKCVGVPIHNADKRAILYEHDFNALYEKGLDPRFRLTKNQVYTRGIKKQSISRLILNAEKGDKVIYLDGNPLNLKRPNLGARPGAGKHTNGTLTRPSYVSLKHDYKNY